MYDFILSIVFFFEFVPVLAAAALLTYFRSRYSPQWYSLDPPLPCHARRSLRSLAREMIQCQARFEKSSEHFHQFSSLGQVIQLLLMFFFLASGLLFFRI